MSLEEEEAFLDFVRAAWEESSTQGNTSSKAGTSDDFQPVFKE